MTPIQPSAAPPSRVGIIVCGMHRSGTSAVTRLINILGADIAPDLMPAMESNAKGFWESKAVAGIHDDLLRQLGSRWDDPMPLPDGWLDGAAARETKRQLAREIDAHFSQSHLFVAKDPRVSRLLPLWLELFADLAILPVVVVMFRNPLEVAQSLRRRDQMAAANSLLIYARCYLEAEAASRQARRLFVHYEDLLTDWRPIVEELRRILGPILPPVTPESSAAIREFLDRELHHNRFTTDELVSTPGISSTTVEMYHQLREASKSGSERLLAESFDRLEHVLREATRLFQGLITAAGEKCRELRAQVAVEHARTSELHQALAAEAGETAQIRDELRLARRLAIEQYTVHDAQLMAQVVAFEVSAADAARLRGEVTAERARVTDLEGALTTGQMEATRLAGELEIARRESAVQAGRLAAQSAAAAQLTSEVAALRDRIARSEDTIAGLVHEVGAIRRSTSWRMTQPVRWIGNRIPRSDS